MAEAAEQLVVSLEARIRDFEKNFQKASRAANDNWRAIEARGEQGARKLETTFDKATRGVADKFKLMASTAAGALTAALGANELKKLVDEWSSARNKIAAAGEELDNVAARQSQLADLAMASRSSLGAVVELYTGLKRSTQEMGATQAQVLTVTQAISKAFAVSGTSSEAAAGAITQLNQALAAGALRGDELNSVLEGAPALARLIAKEFGVGVGQLKTLGEAGKLSADKVFGAILKGAPAIEAEFAKTAPTIAQSIQNITTALTRYLGELDQATGMSTALSGALQGVAANMNTVAPAAAALAAGLAGFYVGGPIGAGISAATVALIGFSDQIRPIAGELASLADYSRVAWQLIKGGAGDATAWFSAQFARAAQYVTAALGAIDAGDALANLLSGVKTVANLCIGAFVAAGHAITGAWDATGLAITSAIVDAMNAVIGAVEKAANSVAEIVNNLTGALNIGIGTSFPTIQPVEIARIAATSRTAGEAAGKAFADGAAAMRRDYIGELDAGLDQLRSKANREAIKRVFDRKAAPDDGSLGAPLKASPAKASGGKGKTAKATSPDEFQREIADLEKRAREFDVEREAIGKEAVEVERSKAAFDLLEAAKKANVTITPELAAKVDALAGSYANAKVELDKAKEGHEQWQAAVKEFGDNLRGAFESAIIGGEKLGKVLDGLLKRLASRMFERAFTSIFETLTIGSAGGGGLLSSIMPKFASGGLVTGRGTGKSDSIVAAVSNGEFIVNAEATRQHRALLEGLNAGHVPRFAAGGLVGAKPVAAPTFSAPGKGGPVSLTSNVTMNAQGGDPGQNADLAAQTAKAVEHQLRSLVTDELRVQMRNGRMLGRMR